MEIEPVGRIEVLKPGVKINGGKTWPQQTLDFTDRVSISCGEASLVLESDKNGINGSRVVWPEDPAFAPQNAAIIGKYALNIGHNPRFGAVELLGVPDSTLRVEFLGHPERNLLEPVFYRQRDNYDPEFALLLRPFNPRRILVMTSPVFSVNLYGGLEEPEDVFTTQAMLVAEVRDTGPLDGFDAQVHMSLMSIAGDWRLRVFDRGGYKRDRWETLDSALERLAKVALFSRHLDDLSVHPWLSQGFSLSMLEGLERYLQLREDSSHDSASAEHFRRYMVSELTGGNFDILEDLRSSDSTRVREEEQRIRHCLFSFTRYPLGVPK